MRELADARLRKLQAEVVLLNFCMIYIYIYTIFRYLCFWALQSAVMSTWPISDLAPRTPHFPISSITSWSPSYSNHCTAQCSHCQLGCSDTDSHNFPCISGNCYRSILSEIKVWKVWGIAVQLAIGKVSGIKIESAAGRRTLFWKLWPYLRFQHHLRYFFLSRNKGQLWAAVTRP